MGSICGIYQRNGEKINPRLTDKMIKELSIYPLDRLSTWQIDGVFLGNCLQNMTAESLLEKIPCIYREWDLAIAGDILLDNREELYSLLGIVDKSSEEIPDNALILHAYRKWGKECPNYLLGDFAFVIFDGNNREMFCSVDHTGNRTGFKGTGNKCY